VINYKGRKNLGCYCKRRYHWEEGGRGEKIKFKKGFFEGRRGLCQKICRLILDWKAGKSLGGWQEWARFFGGTKSIY